MSIIVIKNGFRTAGIRLTVGAKVAEREAARIAAEHASSKAPRLTGRLKSGTKAIGNQVVSEANYAGYVERGTREHGKAQPFFFDSLNAAATPFVGSLLSILKRL